MTLTIDEEQWPLVQARWLGRITDEELESALALVDRWLEGGTRVGFLIDARGALGLSGDQRRRVVSHMRSVRERTARLVVQAVVHDNAIQRTLALIIEAVVPAPYPSKSFGDVEAAAAWLRAELARGKTE